MRIQTLMSIATLLVAAWLLPAGLRAGDKKKPDPKEEPFRQVTVDGQLTTTDLKDRVRQNMYCKTYTFKMIEGHNYQIDMISNEFDSYLRLENPSGDQVAEDDDSGGFPHAKIVFRAPKGGDYTIITTTFAGGATGKFKLIVKDLDAKDDKKAAPGDARLERSRPTEVTARAIRSLR